MAHEYFKVGTTQALINAVKARTAEKPDSDALSPLLTAGAALGITGEATDSAAWLQRVSTSDGPTTIRSIHGRTLVWNQLNARVNSAQQVEGLTRTVNEDGSLTITGTITTAPDYGILYLGNSFSLKRDGSKYLFKASKDTGLPLQVNGYAPTTETRAFIWSNTAGGTWNGALSAHVAVGDTVNITNTFVNIFDLTQMFGAGNEPSTVAEFEALFPEPYYEYDAGSLLSVNMEGIETTGFNQWDEEWEAGGISSTTGENAVTNNSIRSKNYISVIPGQTYYFKVGNNLSSGIIKPRYYDANKAYIGYTDANGNQNGANVAAGRVMPANCHYMRFELTQEYGTTYNHDICINLSDPTRNGTYEPYWQQTRAIPASTLRGAGSVYDEQTETERITRVGVVDLGTLNWTPNGTYWAYWAGISDAKLPSSDGTLANITAEKYSTIVFNSVSSAMGIAIGAGNHGYLLCNNGSTTDKPSGMLYYELATPTTTPIDPPLNMSYRTAAGGTERVMVPTGENSAPPTIVAAQGYTAESLRDAALSAIAPVENGKASANYGIGSYLVHGGQLCKVTTAIATGEAITIGTNVVTTTVMAEVIALTQ